MAFLASAEPPFWVPKKFAEAFPNEDLHSWISGHVYALEYFGGCPTVVVPDNTRTGVKRACRYEPDLNPTYGHHSGPPPKARDKAKVEAGVLVVELWIGAALRIPGGTGPSRRFKLAFIKLSFPP